MINTVDAVRYRRDPTGNASKRLEFNKADTDFNAIGRFNNITKPFTSTTERLVVYNLGVAGADAYAGNVITPAGTTISIDADAMAGEDHITLDIGHQFAFESPRQRLFLIDGPISYYCDIGTGRLLRNSGYAIAAAQPLVAAGTPVTAHLTGCIISYSPGTASRAALITLALTLSDGGESIQLLHQVHVDNLP
jgi:MSHA biogenesis protein MshO